MVPHEYPRDFLYAKTVCGQKFTFPKPTQWIISAVAFYLRTVAEIIKTVI